MSLIGIDHSLVSLCPARERMWIRIVECLAFLDCLTIGAGLSVSLIRLGEYPHIAILAGLFVSGWFAAIQLFMILTNVEGRLKVRGALPRICCIVFLSFCGLAASTGLAFGDSLLLTSWSDWMNPLFLLLFLVPWMAAPGIFCSGSYRQLREEVESRCLSEWYSSFIPRYENFVRRTYHQPTYRLPAGMIASMPRHPESKLIS